MYITRIPNRGSPPAILLREGYRQDGRVKTRTLANLSKLPPEAIELLRLYLKGHQLVPAAEAFDVIASLHVSDHRKTYFFGLSPTGHRSRQPRLWRGIGGNGSVQRLKRPQIEHRQRVGERRGAGELIVPPP